ncbi:MAG TPA: hypothetical protein VK507_00745 [Iamia sp.]|nr:hypothetical protein [Iamia sp.]
MPDPRTSPALRQLAAIGRDPDPLAWSWAVVRLELCGRLLLSPEARTTLGARPGHVLDVRGLCNTTALVLRAIGRGRTITVDRRGRIYVPMWLRRGPSYLIGARADSATVVLVPVTVLDALGDDLEGEEP